MLETTPRKIDIKKEEKAVTSAMDYCKQTLDTEDFVVKDIKVEFGSHALNNMLESKDQKLVSSGEETTFENKQSKRNVAFLDQYGFISGERWINNDSFDAIIVDVREKEVVCEVAIDTETHVFQRRIFARNLFGDFPELTVNYPVLVKIKSKPGALRLEILDGSGIIDEDVFEIKEGIEDIIKAGINKKVEGEISF